MEANIIGVPETLRHASIMDAEQPTRLAQQQADSAENLDTPLTVATSNGALPGGFRRLEFESACLNAYTTRSALNGRG